MIDYLFLRAAPGRRYLLLLLLVGLLGLAATACQKAKPVAKTGTDAAGSSYYTCPMHPQVHEEGPGKCPICGMDLVKATKHAAPAVPAGQRSGGGPVPAPEVMLTNQQIQLANIRVEALGTSTERARTVLTGTLATDATQTSTVSSRVSGRVENLFVRQTVEPIRKGAPLVSIYSEQLQAL